MFEAIVRPVAGAREGFVTATRAEAAEHVDFGPMPGRQLRPHSLVTVTTYVSLVFQPLPIVEVPAEDLDAAELCFLAFGQVYAELIDADEGLECRPE